MQTDYGAWGPADDLFVVNADGSGLRRLTNNPGEDNEAAWSPDGRRIAFTSDRGYRGDEPPADVWVMKADGSAQHRLTRDGKHDEDPAWSPDGTKIAFASDGVIQVMDANGQHRQSLFSRPTYGDEPAWSPDGRELAFVSDYGIWVARADGRNKRSLTPYQQESGPPEEYRYEEPDWSRDGRWIVFEGITHTDNYSGIYEIWLVRADGTGLGQLAGMPPDDVTDPKWRP